MTKRYLVQVDIQIMEEHASKSRDPQRIEIQIKEHFETANGDTAWPQIGPWIAGTVTQRLKPALPALDCLECRVAFQPRKITQIYCSDRCRSRINSRLTYRRAHPINLIHIPSPCWDKPEEEKQC